MKKRKKKKSFNIHFPCIFLMTMHAYFKILSNYVKLRHYHLFTQLWSLFSRHMSTIHVYQAWQMKKKPCFYTIKNTCSPNDTKILFQSLIKFKKTLKLPMIWLLTFWPFRITTKYRAVWFGQAELTRSHCSFKILKELFGYFGWFISDIFNTEKKQTTDVLWEHCSSKRSLVNPNLCSNVLLWVSFEVS